MKRPRLSYLKLCEHVCALSCCWSLYIAGVCYASLSQKHFYKTILVIVAAEVFLLLVGVLTWIRRHLFLHRTLKPRKEIPQAVWEYERDLLGYKVVANIAKLKKNKIIVVDCDKEGQVKYYTFLKVKSSK